MRVIYIKAMIQDWASYPGCMVGPPGAQIPTLKCFEVLYSNLLVTSSALIILALFIMFLIGGWNYLTSLGSPDKIKKAQNTLKFAIIGLILYVGSFLILTIINYLFLQGGPYDLFKFQIGGP